MEYVASGEDNELLGEETTTKDETIAERKKRTSVRLPTIFALLLRVTTGRLNSRHTLDSRVTFSLPPREKVDPSI